MNGQARGYFALGAEGISKPGNLGTLTRTAHAFGASFAFSVASALTERDLRELRYVDTSGAEDHLPFYQYADAAALTLPRGCTLVGVELLDDAIDLPSFRHPLRAAYVLGRERGSLSPGLLERCDFVIKIPTRFCVNVGIAGAVVLYDRMISLGRFAERPVRVGGPVAARVRQHHGAQKVRNRRRPLSASADSAPVAASAPDDGGSSGGSNGG